MTRRGLVALTIIAMRSEEPLASMENVEMPEECRQFGVAEATYYGESFHGRTMANGEAFDKDDPTIAASPTLPLGRRVTVIHPENKKVVTVTITDRMPEGAPDNALDLSRAAAQKLGILTEGRARVYVQVEN
ncbi:MAG: septal ring lytic transglycosylase RlpA family protein [Patescibacteria group bacterium]